MLADVAQGCGAQASITNCMQQNVCIRMAEQTFGMRMQEQSLALMQVVSIFKVEAVSTGQTGAAELATIAFSSSTPRRTLSSATKARIKNTPKLAKTADGDNEWKEF